jgi:ferredoxin-NADP reductase/MOSC domain-containing protein YiiM/ferredoxin
MNTVVSVNVGLPRNIEWQGKQVRSAIWKRPVMGRVMARRLNLDGDGQGDLAGHGGEHRAIMVYQIDSYRYWETYLQRHDFEHGQFGENLTVDGLADNEVCIGDRYRIGGALLEVTQPRVTCYRLGIRMNHPQMPSLVVSHKRPGFYFRVVEEGEIGAGDAIVKVSTGPESVTVAEIDALLYLPGHPRVQLQRALRIPALSAGWKKSLEDLALGDEQAGNVGLAPSSVPPPLWTGFRSLQVVSVHRETSDVLSFLLGSEDRSPLPACLPGQYLVFKIAVDGSPTLRSYSISGSQPPGTYRVSIKRAAGNGSQFFHDHIHAGDRLHVSAPRGSFTLQPQNGPIVLVSAGIGVTPVLAMLHSLAAAASGREIWWCYGARSGREHPFAAEVKELLARLPNSRSLVAYSRPEEADLPGRDYDVSGHLSLSLLREATVPQPADFYLCGPPAFLDSFTADLKSWDVPPGRIHSEAFGPGSSLTPGIANTPSKPPHLPDGDAGTGPNVTFTRSGLTAPWNPRFPSLLAFAEACDVPVKWSCRAGVCHNCESGLVDGTISYGPEPLDRPVNGNILICCSTPLSEVELDL